VPALLIATVLLQNATCGGDAARHIAEAVARGEAFDLTGAAAAYDAATKTGCETAQAAATYIRGLIAARAADAQFGSAASLQPVRQAITSLEPRARVDRVVRAMQSVLLAAVPAAQHERPEMALRIEEMLRLESQQLEAKQPPLPVLSAHEAAGYFWLQLHLYDEARRAFDEAAKRVGQTPQLLFGQARTAAGRLDVAAACAQYQRLLSWWGSRTGSPLEIAEARTYVTRPACAPPSRPGRRP
jgi:hypothetical protein